MTKHHSKDDGELIKALRGTHSEAEAAFAELYSRYAQRTYAFILRMTGNAAISQDILQEVFVKFFKATQQDLVFTNLGSFILMIARNLCLNHKRDEPLTEPIDEMLYSVHELAQSVEQDDLLHLITLSLEVLDLEYREAFILKYYQGYSYEEMSILTGSTIPALKNRVWRAKEQIRNILRPYIFENK